MSLQSFYSYGTPSIAAGILLPSGVYTSTFTSPLINSQNNSGCLVFVNITLATAGTVTVTILGYDPASTNTYTILSSTALGSTGFTVLTVHPGIVAATNSVADAVLPQTFQVVATLSGGANLTYSLGISATT